MGLDEDLLVGDASFTRAEVFIIFRLFLKAKSFDTPIYISFFPSILFMHSHNTEIKSSSFSYFKLLMSETYFKSNGTSN